MDTTTLIGVVGAGVILIFFLLNQTKVLDIDNLWYDLGNTIGSGLLVYYAVLLGSIPFIILNTVWMLFSLKDVVRSLIRK
jgi:hypothetical protein